MIKSTIAPGTTEKFIIPLLNQSKKKIGKDLFLAINPEFLREGFAIDDQLNPHVVVIGCQNNETMKILKNFYQKIYPKKIPIIFTNYATAELIKYSNNAFLATKISFINSISNLCQTIHGANVDEVAKVIGMDPRIGSLFLQAGPGFGGSCLPKDLNALISVLKDNKVNSSLFESVQKINDDQIKLILSILKKNLNNLTGKNISILGLAFKENSDDIRESKSIILIKELLLKKCKINAYDLLAISNTKKILITISIVILIIITLNYFNKNKENFENKNGKNDNNDNQEDNFILDNNVPDKIWVIDFEHAMIADCTDNEFIMGVYSGAKTWNDEYK